MSSSRIPTAGLNKNYKWVKTSGIISVNKWGNLPGGEVFTTPGVLESRTRIVETTIGRALLSEILPDGLSFDLVNRDMTKKVISGTIPDQTTTAGTRTP